MTSKEIRLKLRNKDESIQSADWRYRMLAKSAKKQKTSVAQIVRNIIDATYTA